MEGGVDIRHFSYPVYRAFLLYLYTDQVNPCLDCGLYRLYTLSRWTSRLRTPSGCWTWLTATVRLRQLGYCHALLHVYGKQEIEHPGPLPSFFRCLKHRYDRCPAVKAAV